MKTKVMYEYVKIDDKIPIHKLNLVDMIRAIFLKINESDANNLKNEQMVIHHKNVLKAELIDFIKKATEPIRRGERTNVLTRVSSDYLPVMEAVFSEHVFSNFYEIKVRPPRKLWPGVKAKYKVFIRLKEF